MKSSLIASMAVGSLVIAIVLAGCGDNAFNSGSDDGSTEACKYDVLKSLDNGEYDQVIASSCVDTMDKAAAYMGKSGYDVNDVVEGMIDANSSSSGDEVGVYMNDLVETVSNDSLKNLYLARSTYGLVPTTDSNYDSARFNNVVLVNSLIALSNIKGVMGGTTIPDTSTCDRNNNGTPDKADSAGCAFYIAAGLSSCSSMGASFSAPTPNLLFTGFSATYTGYTVTIDNNGGPTTDPACWATEKKLLSSGVVVATTSDTCTDQSGDTWPCPFEDAGVPVDVVSVFEEILKSADDFLGTIIDTDDTEISVAIDELLTDACGADAICTSQEIADYLQNMN